MAEHLHTNDQVRSKCVGMGVIIEKLYHLKERKASPAIIEHEIDCLYQQWCEINREPEEPDLNEVVSAAGRVA